jgi:hypothetical protein
MILEAPYIAPSTRTYLPNPDWDDGQGRDHEANFKQSMDGTHYSYVKATEAQLLTYIYTEMDRGKLLELVEFQKAFADAEIRLTDYRGDVWRVKFIEDVLDVSMDARAAPGGIISEKGAVTLNFVGTPVA